MNAHRLSTFALLVACSLTPAVAPARLAQAQDAKKDAAILPFIDDGTFLVARLDVDRVDTEALGKYMEESFETMAKSFGIPAEQQARAKQDMTQSIGTTKSWLTDMNDAGGRQFYLLLDTADLMAADSAGPTMVVPLGDGADEQRITDILSRLNGPRMQAANIGNAVVNGSPSAIDRLKR